MDPIQITCKLADKLGQNRFWENRISKGFYESGEYSDEEYAARAFAGRIVKEDDGWGNSINMLSLMEIVKMVLEIQQEEYSKWEFRDEFSSPDEEVEQQVKDFYDRFTR